MTAVDIPVVHDFSVTAWDGSQVSLADYRGQVLLIVNTASQCGFTPQYQALEALHQQLGERGFEVLAFPCNQFRQQEPGSEAQIRAFCDNAYHISFPLFSKVQVNGPDTHPLFQHLKHQARGVLGSATIKWNFTKFLVDRQGRVVRRYAPTTRPEQLVSDIAVLLD